MQLTIYLPNRTHCCLGLLVLTASLLSSCDGSAGSPLCPAEADVRQRIGQLQADLIRFRMVGPYVEAKIGLAPDGEPDPRVARTLNDLRRANVDLAEARQRCVQDQAQESGP
jgi:hypothetical protein